MKSTITKITLLTLTTAMAIVSGCSSGTYQKGASTASSIQKASTAISATRSQVGSVLTALNGLVSTPGVDLKPQFKAFSSQVSKLESDAKNVADISAQMEKRGSSYFEQWDKDIASMQNEEIKSRSATRRAEVSGHLDTIQKAYAAAKANFEPYMANIRDIQKALGADLTPGGIDAIKDIKRKASLAAIPLQDSLTKLANEFSALGVAMSASAPQPKK